MTPLEGKVTLEKTWIQADLRLALSMPSICTTASISVGLYGCPCHSGWPSLLKVLLKPRIPLPRKEFFHKSLICGIKKMYALKQ